MSIWISLAKREKILVRLTDEQQLALKNIEKRQEFQVKNQNNNNSITMDRLPVGTKVYVLLKGLKYKFIVYTN